MLHARSDYNEEVQCSPDFIPEDEPVFLLRGQDIHAWRTVMYYGRTLEGDGADPRMVASVFAQADKMRAWAQAKGSFPDVPEDVALAGEEPPGEAAITTGAAAPVVHDGDEDPTTSAPESPEASSEHSNGGPTNEPTTSEGTDPTEISGPESAGDPEWEKETSGDISEVLGDPETAADAEASLDPPEDVTGEVGAEAPQPPAQDLRPLFSVHFVALAGVWLYNAVRPPVRS
jgi:hypothetical protein